MRSPAVAVPYRIVLTAAPGGVFLRTNSPVVEMNVAEATLVRDILTRQIDTARDARDGIGLDELVLLWPPHG